MNIIILDNKFIRRIAVSKYYNVILKNGIKKEGLEWCDISELLDIHYTHYDDLFEMVKGTWEDNDIPDKVAEKDVIEYYNIKNSETKKKNWKNNLVFLSNIDTYVVADIENQKSINRIIKLNNPEVEKIEIIEDEEFIFC